MDTDLGTQEIFLDKKITRNFIIQLYFHETSNHIIMPTLKKKSNMISWLSLFLDPFTRHA